MDIDKLEKRPGFANESGQVQTRKKVVKVDKNKVEFDFKNIDPKGQLNALVNRDIKITKNNGDVVQDVLRTITPSNQLFMADGKTVYRDSIKTIEMNE